MRKLIPILLLLLIAIPCLAQQQEAMVIQGVVSSGVTAPTADDCSGDLMWSAHFEGIGDSTHTFNVTTGTPAGCVDTDADKTLTYVNSGANSTAQFSDGGYSFYRPAGGINYTGGSFTGFNTTAMSIKFDVYVHAFVTSTQMIHIRESSANVNCFDIGMVTVSSHQYFYAAQMGNGTQKTVVDGNIFSNDQWYTVHAQFRRGTSPYLRIKVGANAATVYTTSDLTAFASTPVQLRFGYAVSNAADYYIDNVKIYTGWQTGTEWGD